MSETMISRDRQEYTIDLLITMVVEEISEDTAVTLKKYCLIFYCQRLEGHCMIAIQNFGVMVRHILQMCIRKR